MGFLFRNWHIKLSAIALATILYTGIVFSGSFSEDTLPGVDVEPVRKPDNTYLFTDATLAVDVDYRVSVTDVPRVGRESFQAVVDLSTYDLERAGEPQRLSVEVTADTGIEVLDWEPRQVTVRLDAIDVRQVPVVVELGELPDGFEVGEPTVEPSRVEIRGPRTRLAEVVNAVARVPIDSSGVDFHDQVTLVAVNADGEEVDPVDIEPELVTVDVSVRATETNKTVPVAYSIVGAPAQGYVLDGVTAEPATITVRGQPAALRDLTSIATAPISIAGVTGAATFAAELILPEGVSLVDEVEVSVTVDVSPGSGSRTLSVGIVCEGAPSGGRCEPALDRITVTVSGDLPVLDQLTADQLTPTVSVAGLGPGRHTVTPSFALPNGVEVLAVSPTAVEVEVIAAPPPPDPTPSPTPAPTSAP